MVSKGYARVYDDEVIACANKNRWNIDEFFCSSSDPQMKLFPAS
jgi:hypothetical protein